jgi:multidrug efflux pump subunit AcrA (membrane-fusion protein)
VAATGEQFWFTGETEHLPPQLESAVLHYVDESGAKELAAVPLCVPAADDERQPPVGVLFVEQFSGSCPKAGMSQRMDAVARHAATALAHAVDCRGSLLPAWRAIRRTKTYQALSSTPRVALITGSIIALLIVLCLPARFDVVAEGTLQPTTSNVFAVLGGQVEQVYVRHGESVSRGTPLVQLKNDDLEDELLNLRTRLATVQDSLESSRRQRAEGERNQSGRADAVTQIQWLEIEAEQLEKSLELKRRQHERLLVQAPADGLVVTWEPERRLQRDRPVQAGDILIEIADPTGPWDLELFVPEERIGHLEAARNKGHPLFVSYIVADDPRALRTAQVTDIHEATQVQGPQTGVLVRAAIDQRDAPSQPRLGITVSARIHCGKQALGYVWFHEVIDFLRRLWFRW